MGRAKPLIRFRLFAFYLVSALFTLGAAQTGSWRVQFLGRSETDTLKPGNTPVFTGRIRVGGVYTRNPISLGLEIQGLIGNSSPSLTLYQGYVQWKLPYPKRTLIRFGRFEMPLGSERLIAKINWTLDGQTFTGIRTKIYLGTWGTSDSFLLIPDAAKHPFLTHEQKPLLEGLFLQLRPTNFLFIHQDIAEWLYFHEQDQYLQLSRTTVESRIKLRFWHLSLETDLGRQQGKEGDMPVRARFAIVNSTWSFSRIPFLEFIQYGEEFYSGDQPGTNVLEGFAQPYSARHRYLGFSDRIGPFLDSRHSGVLERHVLMSAQINPRLNVNVHHHQWKPETASVRTLRKEWDFLTEYIWNASMTFTSGMFLFQDSPGVSVQRFYFFELKVTL